MESDPVKFPLAKIRELFIFGLFLVSLLILLETFTNFRFNSYASGDAPLFAQSYLASDLEKNNKQNRRERSKLFKITALEIIQDISTLSENFVKRDNPDDESLVIYTTKLTGKANYIIELVAEKSSDRVKSMTVLLAKHENYRQVSDSDIVGFMLLSAALKGSPNQSLFFETSGAVISENLKVHVSADNPEIVTVKKIDDQSKLTFKQLHVLDSVLYMLTLSKS